MRILDDRFLYVVIKVYLYIVANYHYYSGAIIGILIDRKKFHSKLSLIKFFIISIIIADVTKTILEHNGTPIHISILLCAVFGLIGHNTLRYGIDIALPRLLKALTDKIVNLINK